MAKCGAFVLPSRKEPWGVVVQEAAAARMPVICSNAVGAGDHLVEDGESGFVFESGNAEELAGKLAVLSSASPERRKEMGERVTFPWASDDSMDCRMPSRRRYAALS